MSNSKCRSAILVLRGLQFTGPIFTPNVVTLHDAFAAFSGHIDTSAIEAATKRLGLSPMDSPIVTEDGHEWFWGARKLYESACAIVLLPACSDAEMEDGTMTDRHSAGYYCGDFSLPELDVFAGTIRTALPKPQVYGAAEVAIHPEGWFMT